MGQKTQHYKNHRRLVMGYHGLTYFFVTAVFVGGTVYTLCNCPEHLYEGLLFVTTGIALAWVAFYARYFALKAQDRAIRAEENFRHYLLTGKPLDSRLRPSQIVALRFAPDEEFPGLAARAAEEKLKNDAIKRLIQHWKADRYRV